MILRVATLRENAVEMYKQSHRDLVVIFISRVDQGRYLHDSGCVRSRTTGGKWN